jgi:Restriction endonuclease
MALEHQVLDTLLNTLVERGYVVEIPGSKDFDYDLAAVHNGRKLLIEVKAWRDQVPRRIVVQSAERLNQAVEREGASEGIIVTQGSIEPLKQGNGYAKVKIMSLRELRQYLSQGRT